MTAIKSSGIEQEVIILKAVIELINSMVNFELMSLLGNDPDSNILFKSPTHQKFFNIILVDFLSSPIQTGSNIEQPTYLENLTEIINTPHFDENNSVHNLKVATQEFTTWVRTEVDVPIWLPSIDKYTRLKIQRLDFLKMTGNISKHHFLKLTVTAKKLKNILPKSGITIDIYEALLALAEFYERFQDILGYHSSTIAEFLNNIRWGIYDYLQPEFNKSIVREGGDPPKYHYTYPKGIQSEFAKTCYWELMNEVSREPYMKKFKVTKWLKLRY